MKKNTLIRNDAPHTVNMPEGSHLAARKVKKTAASAVAPEDAPAAKTVRKPSVQKMPVVQSSPETERPSAKPRAKPRQKAKPVPAPNKAATPLAARSIAAPASPQPSLPSPTPAPLDEAAIWEKDNPVKSRMAQIKARNALLEEQLQRVQPPFQARGRKP